MFDKTKLKEAYIQAIERKLEKAKASYEVAKNDTIEAEGRMVTRYDSSKTETAWLADGCLREVKELEQYINSLREDKRFANMSDIVYADLIVNKEYQRTDKFALLTTGETRIPDKYIGAFVGAGVGDSIVVEEDRQYLEYQIREIQRADSKSTVSIESVVTLLDAYGGREVYYIVNYIGGMEIVVDGENIFCISKQTPLAKVLLGRKKGDRVIVSENAREEVVIAELEV